MPKIPEITASSAPLRRGFATPRLPVSAGGGVGDALAGFGRQIGEAEERERIRVQALTDFNAQSDAVLGFGAFGSAALKRHTEKTGAEAKDFTDGYVKELAAERERVLAQSTAGLSEEGRVKLDVALKNQIARARARADELHTKAVVAGTVDRLGNVANTLAAQTGRDPALLDANLAGLTTAIDLAAPGLSEDTVRDVTRASRAAIVRAAALGHGERGDEAAARALLADPRFDADLTPEQRRATDNAVTAALRAREAEMERRLRLAEREKKQAADKEEGDLITLSVTDPLQLDTRAIAALPNLSPDDKIKWIDRARTLQKPSPIATRPDTFIALFDRIHAGDDDPNKIRDVTQLDPFFGRGLDMGALKTLRDEVTGANTPDGKIEGEMKKHLMTTARAALSGSNSLLNIKDPRGEEQVQRFMAYFLPEYQRQRQAGKSPVDLLNPDSPAYLGKAIERFKRTPQQMMRDMMDFNGAAAPGAPPAKAEAAPAGATNRARDRAGRMVFEVKGKWVYADGTEYKP